MEIIDKIQHDLHEAMKKKEKEKINTLRNIVGTLKYKAIEKGEGTISSFTDGLKGKGVFGTAFSVLGTRLDTNIETFRQLSQTGANFGQSIVSMIYNLIII